jgi:hypothetical protein
MIIAAVTWWTFAVATLAIAAQNEGRVHWRVVGYAIMWPLLLPFMIIALPYDAAVKSTRRIRSDLHNRKMMREFNDFLAARKAQEPKP